MAAMRPNSSKIKAGSHFQLKSGKKIEWDGAWESDPHCGHGWHQMCVRRIKCHWHKRQGDEAQARERLNLDKTSQLFQKGQFFSE
jgi:hypothetical protein